MFLAYLNGHEKSEVYRDGSSQDRFRYRQLLADTTVVEAGFFEAETILLARQLLGCVVVHGKTAGMIVETEAYLGAEDLAAHSARGMTPRTRVIFGPPGYAYVYFIYGMYECLNVVAEPEGQAGGVLIRALEPLAGLTEMRRRRNWQGREAGLANGPGKLTQALAITRKQYGARLFGPGARLAIRRWHVAPQFDVDAGPRIGIRECVDWPLRFTWRGHPCLSRK